MAKCEAKLVIGDDHMDNSCTFTCHLEEGHEGAHEEKTENFDSTPLPMGNRQEFDNYEEYEVAINKEFKKWENRTHNRITDFTMSWKDRMVPVEE